MSLTVVGGTLTIVGGTAIDVGAPTPVGVPGDWTMTFEDTFTGSALDTAKWGRAEGKTMNNVALRATNVAVANGEALLTLANATEGALISTNPGDGAGVGYQLPVDAFAEARVFFPADANGSVYNWPAFWTSAEQWPTGGEHDVAEVWDGGLGINYHYGPAGSNLTPQPPIPAPAGEWGNAWHTYGLHRKATSADVYWDGVKVATYDTDDTGVGHSIIVNVGAKYADWTSPAVYGAASQVRVDYVRAWTGTATVVEPPPPPPPPTSWAHTSEVAALTDEWSSVSDPSGQFSLTTAAAGVRTGTKGLALSFKGNTAASLLTRTGLDLAGTTWRYDAYWKVAGALSFSSYDLTLLEGYNASTLLWRLKMTQDRSFYFERYQPTYAGGGYGVGGFAANTWTKISVRHTGGGSAAGSLALLVNDTAVTSWTGLSYTGTWRPDRIVLGPVAVTATGTMYFDDGLVSAP